jgi:predicted ester cyclase
MAQDVRADHQGWLNIFQQTEKGEYAMSTEENKALFLRYQDALRAKNSEDLLDVLTPDFVGHDLPSGFPPGPESLISFRKKVNEAFPDQQMIVEDLMVVEDKVIARLTLTQTHQSEYMGVAATGKPVTLELIEIDRIENGKIAE